MRILGFSELRPKLQQDEFTTFRFRRRDNDWMVGERVETVYKPRSKERKILGQVEIVSSERRWVVNAEDADMKYYGDYFAVKVVTEAEAIADGFVDRAAMVTWVGNAHKLRNILEPMNKLTLRLIKG